MRIRIVRQPAAESVDGFRLDGFETGREYEVGNTLGSLFLSEGWAEPVAAESEPADAGAHSPPALDSPRLSEGGDQPPPNLIRETHPPSLEIRRLAADRSKPHRRR